MLDSTTFDSIEKEKFSATVRPIKLCTKQMRNETPVVFEQAKFKLYAYVYQKPSFWGEKIMQKYS